MAECDEWQLIETAPKDGTIFRAKGPWIREDGMLARWSDRLACFICKGEDGRWDGFYDLESWKPESARVMLGRYCSRSDSL